MTSGRGPAAVIVLAAGEGTRMRTTTPKMLNEVCGRPMLGHVLAAARELRPQRVFLVVSDLAGQVASYAREFCPEATLVVGHAIDLRLAQSRDLRQLVPGQPARLDQLCHSQSYHDDRPPVPFGRGECHSSASKPHRTHRVVHICQYGGMMPHGM